MKVKNKKSSSLGHSCKFNIHGLGEIIVVFDDGDCSSEYIKDYDVFIESEEKWVDMVEAFKNNLLITDNYNTDFREPINSVEKERGWYF